MDMRILLGIDANFSPATRHAVRAAGELVQYAASPFSFTLLHSIPLTQMICEQPGYYIEQHMTLTPSLEQNKQAEEALQKAYMQLQSYGIAPEHIERCVRVGAIADEIAQVARERRVQLVVVGNRGSAFRYQLRRLLVGSISRRVLQLAPCPVMIVSVPQTQENRELAPWYEDAIKRYLEDHPALTVLTTQQVARQFLPPNKKTAGRQEVDAATAALEHLANSGLLCRHNVKGEIHYVND